MEPDLSSNQWFAVLVRTRWEGSTESLLRGKGYETFLPTYRTKESSNGRKKNISLPLFPGYVFCRFNVHRRLPVLTTPGVISVVGSGKVPIALDDSEISAIQSVVHSGMPAQPWPYLEIGERVRIYGGALSGLEGILIRFRGTQRIVVSVSLLRRSVALEVDRSSITPVCSHRLGTVRTVVSGSLATEGVA